MKSRKKCSDGRRRGLGRREGRNRLKQIWTLQGSLTEGEKFSTVDLLVLARYDNLIFLLKMLCIFFSKQGTIIRRSDVLSLSLQLGFPGHFM
jgi:hypothetical protein